MKHCVDPMLVHCLRCWLSIKPALVQRLGFAGLRVWQCILLAGEYKPTPTQCLLNIGPASLVLASIHSVLVSTSCWRDCLHIAYTAPMQSYCWPASYTIARHRTNARYTDTFPAILTIPAQCFESMLGYCWPTVCDVGPHSAWRQTR